MAVEQARSESLLTTDFSNHVKVAKGTESESCPNNTWTPILLTQYCLYILNKNLLKIFSKKKERERNEKIKTVKHVT